MEQKKKKSKLMIIIPIAIVIIVVVGIVVFMNKTMSKEEMLSIAKELNYQNFSEEMKTNQSRAKEEYNNKIVTFESYVSSIDNNYITLADGNIKVYLKNEDIKKIDVDQKIEVVGKLQNAQFKGEEKTIAGTTYTDNSCIAEMKQAYLIKDTFEITGTAKVDTSLFYDLPDKKGVDYYCYINTGNARVVLLEYISIEQQIDPKNVYKGIKLNDVDINAESTITVVGKIVLCTNGRGETKGKAMLKDIESITINE